MKNKIITAIILVMIPFMAQANEGRDPFSPFAWDSKPAVSEVKPSAEDTLLATPLTKDPIVTYKLIGLIVSPNDSIALIKARDKREYFAYIGDALGMERGIIDVISSEGITIDLNGKLIDLTVSNGFDIQNDSN